jgi:hypothetical protein
MTDKERRARFEALVEIGCCVCVRAGLGRTPPEIHHLLTGRVGFRRAPDERTIGLCPYHHRHGGFGEAIHAGKKTWEAQHGTELELLDWSNEAIFALRMATNLYYTLPDGA